MFDLDIQVLQVCVGWKGQVLVGVLIRGRVVAKADLRLWTDAA